MLRLQKLKQQQHDLHNYHTKVFAGFADIAADMPELAKISTDAEQALQRAAVCKLRFPLEQHGSSSFATRLLEYSSRLATETGTDWQKLVVPALRERVEPLLKEEGGPLAP